MNSSRALNLTCMHFLLNSSQTLRCHFIFFSPPGYLSSFAVILLPCLLPFLRSTLGHVWKSVCGCVCACVCEHLFFFYHCLCSYVDLCLCMIVSPSAWKWNEMADLASERDTLMTGTAGSLWSAAEVLILLFGLVGIWPSSFFLSPFLLSQFLYLLQGSILLQFFPLLASYHFIWLKSLSLTLKLATTVKQDV